MTDLIGKRLGQYEIKGLVGQGGMATVYRAHQPSMERDVAVKVISGQLTNNPEFIARFEHEARMIARLEHAHILPVYDFGREDGTIYLVMRLVDGGSLDEQLRQDGLPLPQAARLITQIASALTYAHQQGVVHRDLKPSNILQDKSGNPYLTDFGIAKLVESNVALTATGTVMGTPSYMAPEQWRGGNIDARTDVYALGVMLYEILTGRLPFVGETPFVLMYKHFDEIPPHPTKVIEGLPDGVNLVIQRAMAKDPADRFASAVEMAEELNAVIGGTGATPKLVTPAGQKNNQTNIQTFVGNSEGATDTKHGADTPVLAVPPARSTSGIPAADKTTTGFSKRLPLLVGLVILLLLIVGGVVFLIKPGQPPYRELHKLTGHTGWVEAVDWSKDGKTIVTASDDKTIRLWNAETGETIRTLRGHTEAIHDAQWSPDGSVLASASEDGTVRLWNTESGLLLNTLKPLNGQPFSLSWSPDGKLLAVGLSLGTAYIFDPTTTEVVKTLKAEGFFYTTVAWSPTGKIIAATGAENSVALWDADSGKLIGEFPGHTDALYGLAWNADGSRLASTSYDGTVRLWDLTTGKALPLLTIEASMGSGVDHVSWSPDGKRLATSSGFINLGGIDDLTAKIWDAETGKLLATLEGHIQPVKETVWSPDGSQLATAGFDQVIRIWSTK